MGSPCSSRENESEIQGWLRKFRVQRAQAKRRGIEWELTFKEWCDFWGEDIDRRGPRYGQLSMQRIADTGPYRLDNIRKGTPARNAKTRMDMNSKRAAELGAALLAAARDSCEPAPTKDWLDDDDHYLHMEFNICRKASFIP